MHILYVNQAVWGRKISITLFKVKIQRSNTRKHVPRLPWAECLSPALFQISVAASFTPLNTWLVKSLKEATSVSKLLKSFILMQCLLTRHGKLLYTIGASNASVAVTFPTSSISLFSDSIIRQSRLKSYSTLIKK